MTEDQQIQLRVQALAFANNLASTLPPQQVIEAAEKYFAFMTGEKPKNGEARHEPRERNPEV